MKILVLSNTLSSALSEIDFDKECVQNILLENSELIINTVSKSIRVPVDVLEFKAQLDQRNRRWDWVKGLVSCVEPQPIVLSITPRIINVTSILITVMETPEEKSKRLGIPMIHEIDVPNPKEESANIKARDELMRQIAERQNQIVSICSCGREITRQIRDNRIPCGSQRCPFGYETLTK